jgi:hypothetical protein
MSRSTSIPYEGCVGGAAALAEIGKILGKFGCQSFGHMIDQERGCTIVQFKFQGHQVSLEASWKGYAAAYLKAHPYNPSARSNKGRANHEAYALELGQRAVCSCLRDWIKGQVTAVECGVMSFGAVFMPHMLLPNGERVIDRVTGPDGLLRLGSDS